MSIPIFIFESGATKTDVLIYSKGIETRFQIDGFNPNRPSTNFTSDLNKLAVPSNAVVYFYGSGIGNENDKALIRTLFKNKTVEVENDLLAAARSLLQKNEGIICINGTGANVGYYNGEILTQTRGGYGYLIDDIGGGLELGKLVISHWLSNDFADYTSEAIANHLKCDKKQFIAMLYKSKNLKTLASVCCIIPNLAKKDEALKKIVDNYFITFTQRHVLPLCQSKNCFKVAAVGSIAHYFSSQLKAAFQLEEIVLTKVLKQPIDNLLAYHEKH